MFEVPVHNDYNQGYSIIKNMSRDCFLIIQRISADYEALLKDHEDVKKKLEASKARNKSLTSELKSLKSQISTLLEKGKHDDELVDALLVRKGQKIYKCCLFLIVKYSEHYLYLSHYN